jgi:DNA repair exonuclease SbcCD ATPase subunit
MAREATITREQVFGVCDTLTAKNVRPTLRTVREHLGSGSNLTINRFVNEWKSGHTAPAVAASALPPSLQRSIAEFFAAEMAAARAPLEIEIAEQQQTNHDLAAENERQGAEIEALQATVESLAGAKSAAEAKAAMLADALATEKENVLRERAAVEQAHVELAKDKLRLESMPDLKKELEDLRAELEQERQKRIDAEKQLAVSEALRAQTAEKGKAQGG